MQKAHSNSVIASFSFFNDDSMLPSLHMKQRSADSPVTISDIARMADVSKATVSRVLTGNAPVNPQTKERILSVMNQHGYVPNHYAQCLAGTPTRIIGVVVGELTNYFFTEVVKGIDTVLSAKGYSMLLCFTDWDEEKELSTVQTLLRNKVDGVILSAASPSSPSIQLLKDSETPFVVVNCVPNDPEVAYVSGDNYEGGRLVAEYINSSIYKRIIVLAGFNDQPMSLRLRGLLDNVGEDRNLIVHDAIPTSEEGRQFAIEFDDVVSSSEPTLIFVSNDNVAIGIENGLQKEVRIPEDVAIIGYDDIAPASFCRVPLTTVSQSISLMGQTSADLLMKKLSKDDSCETHILIPPKFIVRESAR